MKKIYCSDGNILNINAMPARSKSGVAFWGNRSQLSKQIIREQVYDIALNNFKSGVQFDEDNADWVVMPQYVLPKNWSHIAETTPLMIVFPTDYPQIPPIGFYMKADIPDSANGHFFTQAYHDADKTPLEAGWKWYCVFVNPGTWRPAYYREQNSWKKGDNLWTYLTLIKEALSSTN